MKEIHGYFRNKLGFPPFVLHHCTMLSELTFGSVAPSDRCIGHGFGRVHYEPDQMKVCLDAQYLNKILIPNLMLMSFCYVLGEYMH
jgi:hypothetical protein